MNRVSRFGFVAVVGRPNVGKSTLVNRLVGQKLSITAPRPQTTRHRILGLLHTETAQIALIDTPGIHRAAGRAINRTMNRTALAALTDCDLILWMTEAGRFKEDDEKALQHIQKASRPVIAILNKIDRIKPKHKLLECIATMRSRGEFTEIIPLSAKTGTNLDRLVAMLPEYMPESPPLYPPDALTDRPVRFLVAETIREKLTRRLHEEVPYGLSVIVETFETLPDLTRIAAQIVVDRAAHKPIVIGKAGSNLKAVGTAARHDIEHALQTRVQLDLWVRVRENWPDSERELNDLGID